MANILDDPKASRFFHSRVAELADKYPGLDKERATRVLARTVCDARGRSLKKWPKVERSANSMVLPLPPVWFFPDISEALKYLLPDEALALFERDELEQLRMRQLYTSYLASGGAPLYTIKQCASEINELLKQQRKNRRSLVEIGYPSTVFKSSVLLTPWMEQLYPVRWPSEVREEADEYSYTWTIYWKEEQLQCDYEEASLAPNLDIQKAARMESIRSRLYDAKVEVLKTLVSCLRGNDPEAIWLDSKAALLKYLSADEANFLLEIDGSQTGFQLNSEEMRLSARGGLSALLNLIGYCEKELRIGTMAKVYDVLGELIREDERGRPYLVFDSYYQAVGRPEQQKVEDVCDMLGELEEQEQLFWSEYEQRVNSTLAKEFKTEVGVRSLVAPEYAAPYKTILESYATFQEISFHETGKSAPLIARPTEISAGLNLTPKQKKDYEKYQYKNHVKIDISGMVLRTRTYSFTADGVTVTLGGVPLAVLLRLILELKKKQGGWVSNEQLKEEQLIESVMDNRKYYEIRRRLQESDLPKDIANSLIEKGAAKERRLSTHPDFVTYDKKMLLKNPNVNIRKIAERLR